MPLHHKIPISHAPWASKARTEGAAMQLTYSSTRAEARPWHNAFGIADPSRLKLVLLAVAFVSYGLRDAFTGPVRFFAAQYHLAFVWFIPDLMSFAAVGYFVWFMAIRRESAWGLLFSINVFISLIIGWIFMTAPPAALFSAVKMMSPIFLGFAFAGRSVTEVRWATHAFLILAILSGIGLLFSPYVDYPWTGMSVETFGQTKAVGRVWWSGGAMRYGGFAGDSTMAAYMTLFPFILVARQYPKSLIIPLMIPLGYALYLSTNKTAMGCAAIFAAYYFTFEIFKVFDRELEVRKTLTRYSFLLVLVPFILMIGLSGVNLEKIDPALFSMQDRINSTWVFPFIYLADVFPIGLITGCGLGCFVYPMDYTALGFMRVPVDNFYVSTYIMLGFPFILFVIGAWLGVEKSDNREKLTMLFLMNIYAVTVQCYGPSTITIFFGYCFSDMFLTGTRVWRRRALEKADDPAA
ncbi:MAG: hypothetical protein PGN21_16785 [Sphingomonas paucimobilis]